MLHADGDNLRLGRGAVFFDRFDEEGLSTGERFLGNVTSLTLSTADELLEKYSSVEASSPLIKSIKIRRTVTVAMVMDEWKWENIALALMGSTGTASQSALTAQTYTITDAVPGRTYQIGGATPIYSVTNVVVKVAAATKTLDTDYNLDPIWGLVHIIDGGTILALDDVVVTYDAAANTSIKTISGGDSDIEGALRYTSDNASGANDMLVIPKCAIQPEGETDFIGSDDFGALNVQAKILSVPGSDLYNLIRLTGD